MPASDDPLRVKVVMIARDEAGRVGRALSSVRGHVDSWLVIDTGSTDSTIDEIEAATAGWPGVLLRRPWVDFGANRSELLREARRLGDAEWLLTIDADHIVEDAHLIGSVVAAATADAVALPFAGLPLQWTMRLIRADLPWFFVGATREYLDCEVPFTREKVDAPRIRDFADGASRVDKFSRDAELLRGVVAREPENARAWFYLGESFRGLDQVEQAQLAYTNCAVLTAAPEEKYLALLWSGRMMLASGDMQAALERLLMADGSRPTRREALLEACRVLNSLGRHREVIRLLGKGVLRPVPSSDVMGVSPEAYGVAMAAELATARAARG